MKTRLAAGVIALSLIIAGFLVPTSLLPGGGRTLEGWWLAMLGAAVLPMALAPPRFRRAAALTGLLALGSAAQLALTKPTWLHLIDLRPSVLFGGLRVVAVVLAGLHAVVVLWLLGRSWRELLGTVGSFVMGRRLLPAALLFLAAAAHFTLIYPHRDEVRYLVFHVLQLAAMAGIFLVDLANVVLVARSIPAKALGGLAESLGRRITLREEGGPDRPWDRALPRALAVGVLVVSYGLSVFVYERTMHIPDEIAYLFQAKCYAAGRLTLDPPPEPEAFEIYLLEVRDDRWYGTTNPGWPLALAAGVFLGSPWLVNPLLAALSILLAHALTRRLGGRPAAHGVTLLLATSPWVLYLACSLMTHLLTLFCSLLAWWALTRARDGRGAWCLLAGLAMGVVFVVRPLDGLLAGAFTGVAWIVVEGASRPRTWITTFVYGVGCVATGSLLLLFNQELTGDPFVAPMVRYTEELWYPGTNGLGFSPLQGNTPVQWGPLDPIRGHGWRDVLLNTNQNVCNLNFELLGWGVGSLLLFGAWSLRGTRGRNERAAVTLLGLLLVGYNLYWFSGGPDFGPRYWFLMIYPVLWLTYRGGETLAAWLAQRGIDRAGLRVLVGAAALVFVSLGVFVPWRGVAKYVGYRDGHADYRRLLDAGELQEALVLVRCSDDDDFGSALFLNEPGFPAGSTVFARDLGEESNRRLRAAFPGRRVVRIDGRSVTGDTSTIR